MAINVRIYEHFARISMPGRFKFDMNRNFKNAYTPLLNNAAVCEIEIELSQVADMDSSALGMLMLLNERAQSANKTVSLIKASGTVSQFLDVANFSKIFNIKHAALFKKIDSHSSHETANPNCASFKIAERNNYPKPHGCAGLNCRHFSKTALPHTYRFSTRALTCT